SAAQRELLAALAAESERLERTVDDLLDLARNEAGRLPVRSRPCAIERIVADVVGEIAASDAPRVRVETVPPLPLCRCDPGHIKHALRNLIDNAVRFAAHAVHAEVSRRGNTAQITVSDDGPGIPQSDRARVLERFVRLDNARERDRGGSGLGLAIVKHLVEDYGGRVWVEDGKGARFRFTIHRA
ncbi:MAG: HAMP domain-containing histidine kinase, partial [Firmicutes bacterium]|nr:HAMP domain-containing histidine kinase [Bacillota bacterium]